MSRQTQTAQIVQALSTASKVADARSYGNLKFAPSNYEQESGGMWLILTEYQYSKPSMLSTSYNPIPTNNSVSLPIPVGVHVDYAANWGQDNLGAWGSMLAEPSNLDAVGKAAHTVGAAMTKALDGVNSIFKGGSFGKGAVDSIGDTYKQVGADLSKISGIGSALTTDIMTQNPFFKSYGVGKGVARNPFVSALYEGVGFRTFNFNYRLYPTSLAEANTIRSIVRMLKYGMHPSYTDMNTGVVLKNGLFRYPYIYKPEFSKKSHLFEFGMCVITGLDVDYHSENGPFYFESGSDKIPAFITLSIRLMEIEIVTKESIDSAGATGPGR